MAVNRNFLPLRIAILITDGASAAVYRKLAETLATAGHRVSLLLCGEDTIALRHKNIEFVRLPPCCEAKILSPAYIGRPYEAYLWLKARDFDVIHYSERGGFGHYLCSARRQGVAFAATIFCAGVIGPTLWQREAERRFPKILAELSVDFLERESVAHADALAVFDSDALAWMKKQDWKLPEQIYEPTQHIELKPVQPAPAPASFTKDSAPLVSVCLTHHNRPDFLQQALDSIEKQDYPNFEVVLVDDGSSNPAALKLLERLEPVFRAKGWQLIKQENRYQGAAINRAAKQARGIYLKLMDDDNIAKPHELSSFVRAAEATGAAIVTCMLDGFYGDTAPVRGQKPAYRYLFIGRAIAVGAFQNAFGDNNALIRREVFLALGGYCEDYGRGFTDWEFFARAALKGYRIETIPEALFWRRDRRDSMLRTTGFFENTLLSLQPYLVSLPTELRGLLLLARGISESAAEMKKATKEFPLPPQGGEGQGEGGRSTKTVSKVSSPKARHTPSPAKTKAC